MTKEEYDTIQYEKERIKAKIESFLPPTVGRNGKMLRPTVHIHWDNESEEYVVKFVYERSEF